MEPTEHFGIYFGYIRRLFQSWVSPFNIGHISGRFKSLCGGHPYRAQSGSQDGESPDRKPAAPGLVPPPDGHDSAATRDRPGPLPLGGRPPAERRPLGWLYPVSTPDRQDAGPGVPAVPEARMPRRVLPPLQRGAGHTEPRPAAVPSAHAPPLPDDRQHTLPQGS